MSFPANPLDPDRLIGTVIEVAPAALRVNLPGAAAAAGTWHHGVRIGRGEVGEFVFVECEATALFGRIVGVRLPERERLSVEPELGTHRPTHPVGSVQLLTTVRLHGGSVEGGVSKFPRLGARVYSAHPALVKWLAESPKKHEEADGKLSLSLAHLPSDASTEVQFTPERLFGRHCAVLGATGGGKSWTVARLVSEASGFRSKVILLDATGEFHTLSSNVLHYHIGPDSDSRGSTEISFPYTDLKESDLFALFSPSGQTQAPKLRSAMKSLKLARLDVDLARSGCVPKAEREKAEFVAAAKTHARQLEDPRANFDITKLTKQIDNECVWPSGGTAAQPDPSRWGRANENERSYCVSLITRIEDMLQSPELSPIFDPQEKPSFREIFNSFLDSGESVLRISMRTLAFAHYAREIVGNAIGRMLLDEARGGRFRERPMLVFLDEAHQFLSKSLGDESTRFPLDSFELIAKEGRKFCLTLCLATQRPRDLPEGVLSQVGTLIVHRLVNDSDRAVVERASGEIDRSASEFLPTLGPGEAVVIGVDFPIPLTVQVREPEAPPDSRGPDYQRSWGKGPRSAKPEG